MPRLGRGMTIGRGLMMGGEALARGLMNRNNMRYQQQQASELAQALLPEVTPQEMPEFQQRRALAETLIPKAPLDPETSAMDPRGAMYLPVPQAKPGITFPEAEDQLVAAYMPEAEKRNAENAKTRALIKSPNPEIQKYGIQLATAQKKPLSGAERYMNLGGGMVLDMTDQSLLNFSGEKVQEQQVLKPGDIVRDHTTGEILYTAPEKSQMKEWVTEIGGETPGMMQKALVRGDGSTVPLGPEYSATKNVRQTNIEEPPLANDAVWQRKMATDVSVAAGAAKRVGRIKDSYDPFYRTHLGMVAKFGLETADKWLPSGLPAGKAKDLLSGMAQFEQATNENLNLYIKEITGAQMSEPEAKRLSKAVSNLGDSPTVFQAKLEHTEKVLAEAAEILAKEMKFYGGMQGMDYDEALKLAQKRAAAHISDQLDQYDTSAAAPKKESSTGVTAPDGYKVIEDENGNITVVPE